MWWWLWCCYRRRCGAVPRGPSCPAAAPGRASGAPQPPGSEGRAPRGGLAALPPPQPRSAPPAPPGGHRAAAAPAPLPSGAANPARPCPARLSVMAGRAGMRRHIACPPSLCPPSLCPPSLLPSFPLRCPPAAPIRALTAAPRCPGCCRPEAALGASPVRVPDAPRGWKNSAELCPKRSSSVSSSPL